MARHSLLLLSLIAGVMSCDRQASAPSDAADAPGFNWTNNPDNGNFRIQRFEDFLATSWTDFGNGLRATHTTVPLPIGLPQETDCGPQQRLDDIALQFVGLDEWFRVNATGRVWVVIRDVTQAGDCFGNVLVAEGWGQIRYTDNDAFGFTGEGDNQNSNAWGFMASGTLTRAGGGTLRYVGHARFIAAAELGEDGFPILKGANFQVNVR
jgi:hypothetical protein